MAAEEPISSFPMDKEAAEEEIALLVRKPGFDDLNITDIIRHMNNRFNTSFESYKPQLKKMVIDEINKRNQEQNESDSSDDSGSSGSESDSDSDGDKEDEKKKSEKPLKKEEKSEKTIKKEEKSEKQVKKEGKKESQESKHDCSDSDSGVDDAVVPKSRKGRATGEVSDLASNIKSTRRAAASDALKQIRYASGGARYVNSKKKVKDPNADNSGKFGPMTKLCYISTELQQVTKDQWMKRCDVMKVMWDYIKENNLKDPKNGQFVICDDVLLSIFNKKRFKGFGMAKFLTKHIIGTTDMAPDMREAAEAEMEKRKAAWKERERIRIEAERISDTEEGPSSKKPKLEQDDDEDEKNGKDEKSSCSSSSSSSSSSDSD